MSSIHGTHAQRVRPSESDGNRAVLQRQETELHQLVMHINTLRSSVDRQRTDANRARATNVALEREIDTKAGARGEGGDLQHTLQEGNTRLEVLTAQMRAKVHEREEAERVLEDERRAKETFLHNVLATVQQVEGKLSDMRRREERSAHREFANPSEYINTLREVEAQREQQIRRIHEEHGRFVEISVQKDRELQDAQRVMKKDAPTATRNQASKNDEVLSLQQNWDRERKQLMKEFDQLYAVNKEQRFHLHRGTYLKADARKKDLSDRRLEDEVLEMTRQTEDLQGQINDTHQEIRDLVRQFEALGVKQEHEHQEFEKVLSEKTHALARERELSEHLSVSLNDSAQSHLHIEGRHANGGLA